MKELKSDPGIDGLPDALMWVKDAPMFIDPVNLTRFYDAVVRPTFKATQDRTLQVSASKREELKARFAAKAGFRLPTWLSGLFTAAAEAETEIAGGTEDGKSDVTTIKFETIDTPERQLDQLIAFYLLEQEQRLLVGDRTGAIMWQAEGKASAVPRALVMLDLEPRTKLIPMAAEFSNGRVTTFFDKFSKPNGERPPKGLGETRELWKWLGNNFDPDAAMTIIEDAAAEQNSRIEWIDYRLPLNDAGDSMHVHVEAGGRYYTGTFAYRLSRRCYGHGMRLIGTLKDGPDLNVLAIYER
ncbi:MULTISPECIES: hypothetical protein [unclassified Mesorhizobium]|uniref:hypothetical protein n=1 Tax=unclassified Mesorhizobium TaxID=325217 RepID=UPI001128BC16|nr:MULTISPECIES: hypothetical protein [unclassified Mesorhizobium]TPK52906.1 hypothetical protein FJ550_14505 [Mesorhizobium sp. B2-5-2]TPL21338.1 hypothetical protein FJ946_21415 [Mesorhizobium sp. B2-4-7]TPL42951.1 hypothetical protein FJ961_09755 [Mesorhizobium sp. B2-4-5]TPM76920.1 hypothetical protein FJ968_04190 [Mesorhizobium sp. B2-1-6]TPN80048.1 hypothetical protein FJ985_02115 [Mesorhizobium sp. B1-1-2]